MASFLFKNVYFNEHYSVAGPYENNGLIRYDEYIKDFYNDSKTFEQCEINMQKTVLDKLILKNKLSTKIELVIGGDLANQISATGYNIRNYDLPFLGVYGACSTFIESAIIMSSLISSELIKKGICITSAHNLTSERQFRFPIEYGSPKHNRTTWTSTGSVGAVISSKRSLIKIVSGTIGQMVDYGINDPNYLGAAMAPSAAKVLIDHLNHFKKKVNDYDLILTGDLGVSGSKLFKILLEKDHNIKLSNHLDAGCLIYRNDQETYDGASGPTALPLVFFNKIIKQKKYRKILLIATGAMHSPVMVNQKESIPGISYLLSVEVKQ